MEIGGCALGIEESCRLIELMTEGGLIRAAGDTAYDSRHRNGGENKIFHLFGYLAPFHIRDALFGFLIQNVEGTLCKSEGVIKPKGYSSASSLKRCFISTNFARASNTPASKSLVGSAAIISLSTTTASTSRQ